MPETVTTSAPPNAAAALPTAVTSPTAPAAAQTPVAGATPAAAPWYGDLPDPELKGWAELKGWKSPAEALKSAREAEKMLGVPKSELIRRPKDDAKPEEMNAFYDALGRPATPDDYKLEVPMGDNGDFAKRIAPILHEAGISLRTAQFLNTKWNELMASTLEESEQQTTAQSQADLLNLQREWGQSYDKRVELGRRALRTFGAELGGTPDEQREELLKLENYLGGSAKMIKLFAAIGSKLGEANFVDGDAGIRGFDAMTPAAAGERIKELFADKEWRDKYMAGGKDSAQGKELDALQRVAISGGRPSTAI